MYLFICENYKDRGSTEELLQKVLEAFICETALDIGDISREISRTEKGKPYFAEIPVEFSVSHTADIWVCLMMEGDSPVGVDIQQVKEYRYEKIAEKYYTEQEKQQVRTHGADAFFRIWTCKEAYAKYTGRGIGRYLKETDTIDNKEVVFTEFEIRDGIKGACCMEEKKDLWIIRV